MIFQNLFTEISNLKDKNNKLETANKKSETKINYLINIQQRTNIELEQTKQNCVKKSTLKKCQENLLDEKRKYQAIELKIFQINKSFQVIKSSIVYKLIQAYKTYRNLYNIKVQNEKKEGKLSNYDCINLIYFDVYLCKILHIYIDDFN